MTGQAFSAIRTHHARITSIRTMQSAVRVLAVDDDEGVRGFVGRVLRDAGYAVTVAPDGAEAIEVARRAGPFDVLVTDLKMPQMSGDEMARRLRHDDPELKVLYLTGYSDYLFKERLNLWEDEAFLDKPCSVNALLEAVSLVRCGHLLPVAESQGRFEFLRHLLRL